MLKSIKSKLPKPKEDNQEALENENKVLQSNLGPNLLQ